ncbi:MAG: NAD(P)-binding domain-containing protein, partial [Gammaproteobacteria bacterium]
MNIPIYDCIIVGAGHCGLAASYYLQLLGIKNTLILEKSTIGNSWENKTWDNFHLITPIYMNQLPKSSYSKDQFPFLSKKDWLLYLRKFTDTYNINIQENVEVKNIKENADGLISINTEKGIFSAKSAIISTGYYQKARYPKESRDLKNTTINQLHSSEYKNISQLLGGNVIIIGSGQSGCQIASEILKKTNKQLYISVGSYSWLPRKYQDEDITYWLNKLGFYEKELAPNDDYVKKAGATNTCVSIDNNLLTYYNLNQLSEKGAILLGRIKKIDKSKLFFDNNLRSSLEAANQFNITIKNLIDNYLIENNLKNNQEIEPWPQINFSSLQQTTVQHEIDLQEKNITNIIWCTGYTQDYSWIDSSIFDAQKLPPFCLKKNIYMLGTPWSRTASSGLIYGGIKDAKIAADAIKE